MKQNNCSICGRKLINRKRYCSDGCRKEAERRRKLNAHKKVCTICGKSFIGVGECCSVTCRILNSGFNPYLQKEPAFATEQVMQVERQARAQNLSYGQYVAQSEVIK